MTEQEYDFDIDFSRHQLVPVNLVGAIEAYYLKMPYTTETRVLLIFSPEGVHITGDLPFSANRNGFISDYGLDAKCFAECDYSDTLCKQFLRKEFVPDNAAEVLQRHVDAGHFKDEEIARLVPVIRDLRSDNCNEYQMWRSLGDILRVWNSFGHDYNPCDCDLLCKIQKRFAELWQEPAAVAAFSEKS